MMSTADLVCFDNDDRLVTTSLMVAQVFKRRHGDVLRAIQHIECSDNFAERNFALSAYKDVYGGPHPSDRFLMMLSSEPVKLFLLQLVFQPGQRKETVGRLELTRLAPDSSGRQLYLFFEITLVWCHLVQRLMSALSVIIFEPTSQALSQFQAVFKRMQMQIMILHRPPETFDKYVVHASSAAIHADFDTV